MGRFFKGSILVAVILVISILIPHPFDTTDFLSYRSGASETDWSESVLDLSSLDSSGDAFTILEIVPYEGMGEIGYLVGGQEPVNAERMSFDTAQAKLSFLGGAISIYRSYEEGNLPASGVPDEGWQKASHYIARDGYFEFVGLNRGDYVLNIFADSYYPMAKGTGKYKAELTGEMQKLDDINSGKLVHQRNVNAYFVYGKPEGVTLYNQDVAYQPYSVARNPEHKGDYDYDYKSGAFYLNQGKGSYDVIFQKANEGTELYYMLDNYEIVSDCSGTYSWAINYTYVGETGGDYDIARGISFVNTPILGMYRFVESDEKKPYNYYREGNRIWVQNQQFVRDHQFTHKVTLLNNEWMKRFSLGVASDRLMDFPVEVVTITPKELNKTENLHYIREANLIYINSSYEGKSYIELYESYNNESYNLPKKDKYSNNDKKKRDELNFAVNDLSWNVVMEIFKRAAGIGYTNRAGVVFDNTIYRNAVEGNGAYKRLQKDITVSPMANGKGATVCNTAKLYIMLYQRRLTDFYNAFINPGTGSNLITEVGNSVNRTGSTGSFVRPGSNDSPSSNEAIYWNGNTFLPFGLNQDGKLVSYEWYEMQEYIPNYSIDTTANLNENILSVNGKDIFTASFLQKLSISSITERYRALTHLISIGRKGGLLDILFITAADYIYLIMNNGLGYANTDSTEPGRGFNGIRVLNIQPTADFDASESTIRDILLGHSNLQVINMTSNEFNSSIEDLNSNYDLIYIGGQSGRFNHDGTTTDFNDPSLNGYVYFTEGDQITTSSEGGEAEVKRYTGNDVTVFKKNALNEFLQAGYPIILEEKLYLMENVAADTNLYSFISDAKGGYWSSSLLNLDDYTDGTDLSNLADWISFYARLIYGLSISKPRTVTYLRDAVTKEGCDYVYIDPEQEKLTIELALYPNGVLPGSYSYNSDLYIDFNRNGLFEENENTDIDFADGIPDTGIRESYVRRYRYEYDLSGRHGVYQWMVLTKRVDNPAIRSERTGYAVISRKETTLHALHIIDGESSYSLQENMEDEASLVRYYTRPERLQDYRFKFETMTVDAFEQLYEAHPYMTETADRTNQLSEYHLIIMDNRVNAISNDYGALTNIKDELGRNLGIVFTKGAIDFISQSLYYDVDRTIFLDRGTYPLLTRDAIPNGQRYLFSGMEVNGDLQQDSTYTTSYITRLNHGTITNYPYRIGEAALIKDNSFGRNVTADFDLRDTSVSPLIVWYCLSDRGSPVIRDSYPLEEGPGDMPAPYQGIYSSSPNDARNNYYLLSRSNSYYMGINLLEADRQYNDEEIKLFINTIVAAGSASERTISIPPSVSVKDPKPHTDEEGNQVIVLSEEDIRDSELQLTFELSGSISLMEMQILWDGSNPIETWNDSVYPVSVVGGELGDAIPVNNESKVLDKGLYVLKIPIEQLQGSHKLILLAKNMEGSIGIREVMIDYLLPPGIRIVEPELLPGPATGYLYVTIDYFAEDTEDQYISRDSKVRIVIEIEKAVTPVYLQITSEDTIPMDDIEVYNIHEGQETDTRVDISRKIDNGRYAVYLPVHLLKGRSSRSIIFLAIDDSGGEGSVEVTLLRRNLFPLD